MAKKKSSIVNLRTDYKLSVLSENKINKNPIRQFELWMNDALKIQDTDANAMALATVDKKGMPNCRIVLLRGIVNGEFLFYTNYKSRKGSEIADNGKVALTFFWYQLQRQIRIRGSIHKVDSKISDEYFNSRPRSNQLGAWSSEQSSVIKNRIELENALIYFDEKFSDSEIIRPKNWGGYAVKPISIEFWQGRSNRLHDRIEFISVKGKWKMQRLAP